MIRLELIGQEALGRKLSSLERDVFPKAASRALNRTTRTVLSRTAKSVSKFMGITQSKVKKGSKIRKATPGRLEAEITLRGKALNLIHFRARQVRKGVSAAPWRNRRVYRGAFIVKIEGVDLVMRRVKGVGRVGEGETQESRRARILAGLFGNDTKKDRLPIRAMLGPGVAESADEPEMIAERKEIFDERMRIEIVSQLKFLTR